MRGRGNRVLNHPGTVKIDQLACPTAGQLAKQLRVWQTPQLRPNVPAPDFAFVLFWGPPGALADAEKVTAAIPGNVPAIGASAKVFIAAGAVRRGWWGAVRVTSPYITPRAAISELALPEDRLGSAVVGDRVKECVGAFVDEFKAPGYFTEGKDIRGQRLGPHRVRYSRPAFLLLFLPRMGTTPGSPWPRTRIDSQVVETLAAKMSRDVPLFGGSAVESQSRSRGKVMPAWVAARIDNKSRVIEYGLAGLLVETDLTFGCASEHGCQPDPDHGHLVDSIAATPELSGPTPRSRPPRSHVVTRLGSPPDLSYRLDYLDHPLHPRARPDSSKRTSWHTLVVYESEEVVPNPPYKWNKPEETWLVRPVSEGMTLYHAVARRRSLLDSVTVAMREAREQGQVRRPDAAFFVGCKGRVDLMGKTTPQEEFGRVTRAAGAPPAHAVFGMYAAGETCPSRRGANRHRNWTSAILLLGGDFNAEYAATARAELLGNMDQALIHSHSLQDALQKLVEATSILTQVDSCHMRMLTVTPDGESLELVAGIGPISEIIPKFLRLDDPAVRNTTAYRSIRNVNRSDFERYSGAEYLARNRNFRHWAAITRGGVPRAEVLASIRWWYTFPIETNHERLGTLTLAIRDSRLVVENDPESEERIRTVAKAVIARAAAPIRIRLMREAFEEALSATLKSPSNFKRDVDDVKRDVDEFEQDVDVKQDVNFKQDVVNHAIPLIGRNAYLSLMLPNPKDPTTLVCVACGPPPPVPLDAIFVSVAKDAPPEEKGICGWVFEHGQEQICDDITLADGRDGGPRYKPCLSQEIGSNYALPLKLDGSPRTFGVLNVEAHPGVLNRQDHLPLLRALAQACAVAVRHEEDSREAAESRQYLTARVKKLEADVKALETGSAGNREVDESHLYLTARVKALEELTRVRALEELTRVKALEELIDGHWTEWHGWSPADLAKAIQLIGEGSPKWPPTSAVQRRPRRGRLLG